MSPTDAAVLAALLGALLAGLAIVRWLVPTDDRDYDE